MAPRGHTMSDVSPCTFPWRWQWDARPKFGNNFCFLFKTQRVEEIFLLWILSPITYFLVWINSSFIMRNCVQSILSSPATRDYSSTRTVYIRSNFLTNQITAFTRLTQTELPEDKAMQSLTEARLLSIFSMTYIHLIGQLKPRVSGKIASNSWWAMME